MTLKNFVHYFLILLFISSCGDGTNSKQSADTISGLQIVAGNLQQATAGQPIQNPLIVQALDTDGNPVTGQTVEFSIPASSEGNAIFSPVTTTTNAQGLAQTSIQLGNISGKVTIQGLWLRKNEPQIALATFTSIPDAPVQIIVVSGDNQCQQSGHNFEKLVVKTADQFGNGVPFQTIRVDTSRAYIITKVGKVFSQQFDSDPNGLAEITLEAGDVFASEGLVSSPHAIALHLNGSLFNKVLYFVNSLPPTIVFTPSPLQALSSAASYTLTATSYDICGVKRANKVLQFFVNDIYKKTAVTNSTGSVEVKFTNSDFPKINSENSFIQGIDFGIKGSGFLLVKHF